MTAPSSWRKSSYSHANGNCVEVATLWRRSSFSMGNGNCVEIAELDGRLIGVRDSQDPDGPVLEFDWGTTWRWFVRRIKTGWQPE